MFNSIYNPFTLSRRKGSVVTCPAVFYLPFVINHYIWGNIQRQQKAIRQLKEERSFS